MWIDRLNRQKLLIVTQSLSMLQSFLLAFFTLTHRINIPGLIGLALMQGLINALDIPGRQAFLIEMVDDRNDLPNAIALNSTMVHSALAGARRGGITHSLGRRRLVLFVGRDQLSGGDCLAVCDAHSLQPPPAA